MERDEINARISAGVKRYHDDIAEARAEVLEAYGQLEALTRMRAEGEDADAGDLALERHVLRKLDSALDRLRAERAWAGQPA